MDPQIILNPVEFMLLKVTVTQNSFVAVYSTQARKWIQITMSVDPIFTFCLDTWSEMYSSAIYT